jgi:hypothetical protein
MSTFLGKLLGMAEALGFGNTSGGVLTPGFNSKSFGTTTTSTYRGVVITSLSAPGLNGVSPSFAVVDKMGIVGSSLTEVKAVIDAHLGGSNITADPTYQAASSGSLTQPAGIMYVNVGRVSSALQKLSTGTTVDNKAVGYLAPLQAFMLTATSQAGAAVERFFVVIK